MTVECLGSGDRHVPHVVGVFDDVGDDVRATPPHVDRPVRVARNAVPFLVMHHANHKLRS